MSCSRPEVHTWRRPWMYPRPGRPAFIMAHVKRCQHSLCTGKSDCSKKIIDSSKMKRHNPFWMIRCHGYLNEKENKNNKKWRRDNSHHFTSLNCCTVHLLLTTQLFCAREKAHWKCVTRSATSSFEVRYLIWACVADFVPPKEGLLPPPMVSVKMVWT